MDYIKKLIGDFISQLASINWKSNSLLTNEDKDKIRQMLKDDYFIILTRRSNFLSTYFINFAEIFLRGKFGYWAHSVMNIEDTVTDDKDFILLEATGVGVHFSDFENVFNVQSVALLKPRSMTIEEWTTVLDDARNQVGKPYDPLFNIHDETKVSCIELVRDILKASPGYDEDFKHFEAMIKKSRNVTPQMLYDCPDFQVFIEFKR